MWAMIPMFRVRSSGMPAVAACLRAVLLMAIGRLPLEMAEGAVCLSHPVGVLAALDRGTDAVRGVDELAGQLLCHALPVALAGGLDQPAHAEADSAIGAHLDRDLVSAAAHALG